MGGVLREEESNVLGAPAGLSGGLPVESRVLQLHCDVEERHHQHAHVLLELLVEGFFVLIEIHEPNFFTEVVIGHSGIL